DAQRGEADALTDGDQVPAVSNDGGSTLEDERQALERTVRADLENGCRRALENPVILPAAYRERLLHWGQELSRMLAKQSIPHALSMAARKCWGEVQAAFRQAIGDATTTPTEGGDR